MTGQRLDLGATRLGADRQVIPQEIQANGTPPDVIDLGMHLLRSEEGNGRADREPALLPSPNLRRILSSFRV